MNQDQFWEIIETTKAAADGSFDGHARKLASHLATLAPEEIVAFDDTFRALLYAAYRSELWGAAFLINGGCGDDSFTDFRSWLISMGRRTYEAALADPESLVDVEIGPDGEEDTFFEEFAYVAGEVYQAKTGKDMSITPLSSPLRLIGEPFEEGSEAQARQFPRLFAKYGEE